MPEKQECEKKRVLIVHNSYQIPGGEDAVVRNEKRMLEEHGHAVFLYTRHNSELNQMTALQKLLLPFTTVFNLRTYKEVKKIIREQKIQIVHVHNTLCLVSPAVYYAAKACKVPVVQTVHNFRLLCPAATFYRDGHICEDCVEKSLWCSVKHKCYRESRLQTLACVISTKIHRFTGIYGKIYYICLTEFNKEKILRLKHIPREHVFVKPNFVDASNAIVPADQRENQIVFAGRLDKLKGVDLLLKAWKRMGSKAPQLIICGTGPLKKWCETFISENNLHAEMKGFLPNEQVREIIAHCKALILPTQWYEGFPMNFVESFSVGTPVVCSNLGNSISIVQDGLTGYKFDPNSEEDIISAIDRIYESPQIYDSTYLVYNQKYTPKANYNALCEIYKKAQITQ